MRSGTLFVEAVRIPGSGAAATVAVANDEENWYGFVAGGTDLRCVAVVAGRVSDHRVRYDPQKHHQWRVRFASDASAVIWETSADGNTWSAHYHAVAAIPVSATRLVIEAGSERPAASPGKAIFDNVIVIAR